MAQYRSTLITQRLRMDAVEHMISKATQMSQNDPKGQKPTISVTAFQGMTKMATNRSDTASEMTKKLVTLERRWRNLVTAAQTSIFPSRVERMRRDRKQPVRTRIDWSLSNKPLSFTVEFKSITANIFLPEITAS